MKKKVVTNLHYVQMYQWYFGHTWWNNFKKWNLRVLKCMVLCTTYGFSNWPFKFVSKFNISIFSVPIQYKYILFFGFEKVPIFEALSHLTNDWTQKFGLQTYHVVQCSKYLTCGTCNGMNATLVKDLCGGWFQEDIRVNRSVVETTQSQHQYF